MPKGYVKPPYKSNKEKYQSNADRLREAEKNSLPRQRPADSDHVKIPPKKQSG